MPSVTKSLLQSESALVSIIQDLLVSEDPDRRVIATPSICLCILLLNIECHSFPVEERRSLICGFLTNEVRVVSYNLRVTIHCNSYDLFFMFKFRVTNCTICDCKIYWLKFLCRISHSFL